MYVRYVRTCVSLSRSMPSSRGSSPSSSARSEFTASLPWGGWGQKENNNSNNNNNTHNNHK